MSRSSRSAAITTLEFGVLPYREARMLQESLAHLCRTEEVGDFAMLLEHPPTVTRGRRASESDLGLSRSEWTSRGVDVFDTDRGGFVTFHNPGQLIVYPVIDLPGRKLGLRAFVERGLGAVAAALGQCGVEAEVKLQPAGVWCGGRKIAAVGLRIIRGVTSHGFSINVENDLQPFSWFNPCSLPDVQVTSLAELAPSSGVSVARFKEVFVPCLLRELS